MPYNFHRIHPWAAVALQELGGCIRDLCAERGLVQRALAARAGVSQSMISRLENGKAPGASVEVLARVLAGLGGAVEQDGPAAWTVDAPPWWRIMAEAFSRKGRLARRIEESRAAAIRDREARLVLLMTRNGSRTRRPKETRG